MTIELKLKSGGSYFVTELEEAALVTQYPSLDVHQEILLAQAWLEANHSHRKTHTGIKRFLVSWLNRSADKASSRALYGPKPAEPVRQTPSQLPYRAQQVYDAFAYQGLLPEGFQPLGNNDSELIGSIRAKATIEYFHLHPDETSLGCPGGQTRNWLNEVHEPAPIPSPPQPIHGDAYEEPTMVPATDTPPLPSQPALKPF